jgi:hypothetical protein
VSDYEIGNRVLIRIRGYHVQVQTAGKDNLQLVRGYESFALSVYRPFTVYSRPPSVMNCYFNETFSYNLYVLSAASAEYFA